MSIKNFLFISFISLQSVWALDIFDPCSTAEMETSFSQFKASLRKIQTGIIEPKTDKEIIISEINQKYQRYSSQVHENILYIEYLKKLVQETDRDVLKEKDEGKFEYARQLQSALRGSHCGGINPDKQASLEEENIMLRAAQEVGEMIAPCVLVVDKDKRQNFFKKDSIYWKNEDYYKKDYAEVPKAIKTHVNIVSTITKETALRILSQHQAYGGIDTDTSLYKELESYSKTRKIDDIVPYPGLPFATPFLPDQKDLHAKTSIRWIAFLDSIFSIDNEDIEKLLEKKKKEINVSQAIKNLSKEILEKYSILEGDIKKLVSKFNSFGIIYGGPWSLMNVEQKTQAIQMILSFAEQQFGAHILENRNRSKTFNVDAFKNKIEQRLKGPLSWVFKVNNLKGVFDGILKKDSNFFGIPYAAMESLLNCILQHSNLTQEEVENMILQGLIPFIPSLSKNPSSSWNILNNIFRYLKPIFQTKNPNPEIVEEAFKILTSIDYANTYYEGFEHTDKPSSALAKAAILDFLELAILDQNPNTKKLRKEAIHQFKKIFEKQYEKTDLNVQNSFEKIITSLLKNNQMDGFYKLISCVSLDFYKKKKGIDPEILANVTFLKNQKLKEKEDDLSKDEKQALYSLEKAIDDNKLSTSTLMNLLSNFRKFSENDIRKQLREKIVEKIADDVDCHPYILLEAGGRFEDLGKKEKARALYQRGVNHKDSDSFVIYYSACNLDRLGFVDQAKEGYTIVAKDSNSNEYAKWSLERLKELKALKQGAS